MRSRVAPVPYGIGYGCVLAPAATTGCDDHEAFLTPALPLRQPLLDVGYGIEASAPG